MVKYEGGCVPEGDLAGRQFGRKAIWPGLLWQGELNEREYTICGSQEKVF